MQHVFIVGAKGFTYGGYETFLDNLQSTIRTTKILNTILRAKQMGQE